MARFATTHWSVILQAGEGDTDRAREALEHICQRYWYPLYAYVRRRGYDPHAARDATQAFFAHFIENEVVAKVDRSAGRFRTFLLSALSNHLASEIKKAGALKRGGGVALVSLDEASAEARFASEPRDDRSPDKLFDRSWAMNLLEQALRRLEQEYEESGRTELFQRLQHTLIKEADSPAYREIAGTLGMTEGAIKVAVHRLRQRFREILTGLVASTISDPVEVEEELRYLVKVVFQ